MLEKTWVVGSFQCNCRLIACPRTGHGVLVDPGDEPEVILKGLEGLTTAGGVPIQIQYLFHTHGHLDHIGAARPVREALAKKSAASGAGSANSPKIALHRGDEPLYKELQMQGKLFGLTHYETPLPVDHYFQEGEDLQVGDLKFTVIHTPGHSPGSVSLRLHEDSAAKSRESVFSGDTLFQGSVGRTDLWGGDADLMFRNIRKKLLVLDGDTRVCPGHGPDSLIGVEKRENPFLK